MLHGINNMDHDITHQITKCMHQHKHMQPQDGDMKSGAGTKEPVNADVPEQQDAGGKQNVWNLRDWLAEKKGRIALRTGRGNIAGTGGVVEARGTEPISSIDSQEGIDDTAVRNVCMSAMLESERDRMPRLVSWMKERIKKLSDSVSRVMERYMGGGRFREQDGCRSREEALSGGQDKKEQEECREEACQKGVLESQEFLLDSYNRNGEYTKIMK